MKYPNLHKTLSYFDGESGLSNQQVLYFLNESFKNKTINELELQFELKNALKSKNFNWKDFTKDIKLLNDQEQLTSKEIKRLVVELFEQVVLPFIKNEKKEPKRDNYLKQ